MIKMKSLLIFMVLSIEMIFTSCVVYANEIATERPPGYVITMNVDNNIVFEQIEFASITSNSYLTGIEDIWNASPENVEPYSTVVVGGTIQDKTLSCNYSMYSNYSNLNDNTDKSTHIIGKSYLEMGYSIWYINQTSSRER